MNFFTYLNGAKLVVFGAKIHTNVLLQNETFFKTLCIDILKVRVG